MYLERLELQGFKSFATKTALEFGRGITAIVGPNGSGKSNVADAIRWVLGEQSLKTIRGKKAEDVIFAGSDKKTKLGAAEVSLHLNNEDRAAPIDFSQLVITRRVFRDGTGEYLINKRQVRLQDIQMLLAKSNFGQRTYSVIGQGMVDAILMTSPLERKQFFDEAAGVRQYQLKREQAVTKLDHTRENLRQAEALLQEIEPRLRSLTRQVRRLERRAEIERQLSDLQVRSYGGTRQALQSELFSATDQLRVTDGERQKHQQAVDRLHGRLSSHEGERSRSESFSALQRQYERLQAQKGIFLAEEAVLKGQRDVAFTQAGKTNVVWLEKQAAALTQQAEELESEAAALTSAFSVDELKVRALMAERDGKQAQFNQLQKQLQVLHRELAAGAVTIPDLQAEFAEFAAAEEAFFDELSSAGSIESLGALQKRGQELRRRVGRLADRLSRLGATSDASKVVELQRQLDQALTERDAILRTLRDAELAVLLRKEKLDLIASGRTRVNDERSRLDRELARAKAESKEDVSATVRGQLNELRTRVADVDQQIESVNAELQSFNMAESQKRDELFRLQRELRSAQDLLNAATTKQNDVRVEAAKLETRLQDLEREVREEVPEEYWPAIFDSAEKTSPPTAEQAEEILRVKHQLQLIGGIDEGIEQEYSQTNERYTFLKTQFDDLIKASAQLEDGIAELDQTIKERFDQAFARINEEFGKYFKMLFNGGVAKLVLQREVIESAATGEDDEADDETGTETETPVAKLATGEKVITGIDIQATPPGKRLKGIAMLSGGERALTSIALICAIISNNPSPFVVLDEVDAALDEANSQRFAAILSKLAEKTQFVTITHNRATMEKSNILYGVTMGDDGVSRLLSVKLEEAEKVIQQYGNR